MTVLELQEARQPQQQGREARRVSGNPIEVLRSELDGYLEEMQTFEHSLPDEVFRRLSAWTARATELKIQLNRTDNQRARSFRTGEIDPFLEECDRQFKLHSRIQASQEMDMRLVPRGQT